MARCGCGKAASTPLAGLATLLVLTLAQPVAAQSIGGVSSSGGGSLSGSSSGGGFNLGGAGMGSGGGQGGSGLQGSSFLPSGSAFLNSGSAITPNRSSGSQTSGNPFTPYYANPMATGWIGLNTTNRAVNFGSPLYGTLTQSSAAGTATLLGGRSSGSAFAPTTTGLIPGVGGRRGPSYVAVLGFEPPPIDSGRLRTDLQQVIARSGSLPSNRNILVVMDGAVVVLRGAVAGERERRLAESLVRLSPGVREVRNELELREVTPPPTPVR